MRWVGTCREWPVCDAIFPMVEFLSGTVAKDPDGLARSTTDENFVSRHGTCIRLGDPCFSTYQPKDGRYLL